MMASDHTGAGAGDEARHEPHLITAQIVMHGGALVVRLELDGRAVLIDAPTAQRLGAALHRLGGQIEGLALALCGMDDIGLSARTIERAAVAALLVQTKRAIAATDGGEEAER